MGTILAEKRGWAANSTPGDQPNIGIVASVPASAHIGAATPIEAGPRVAHNIGRGAEESLLSDCGLIELSTITAGR